MFEAAEIHNKPSIAFGNWRKDGVFGRLKLVGLTIMVGAGRWHSDDYSAVVCVLMGGRFCNIPTFMFGVQRLIQHIEVNEIW